MRIAFLGTPEFAVPSLLALIGRGDDVAVFTQPDRPVGRHKTPVAPPVKQTALEHGIPVFQFEKIKSPEGVEALRSFRPDWMVTAAFGQILSAEDLAVPEYGCVNVHGSLLPKYRGAAPIQWAVINGETETGITTMLTDIGMDTGNILLQRTVPVDPDETAGELYDRLAVIGADVLLETLAAFEKGSLTRIPQDASAATVCPMLKKEHGRIDFHKPARAVHNLVRGVNPWPGAYAELDGQPVKIWKTALVPDMPAAGTPGTCSGSPKEGLYIACGEGNVQVLELQLPGGKRLDAATFLRGNSLSGKILT